MDFYFESTAPLDLGKDAQKFAQNMAAIRILKACEAGDRPATAAEQAACPCTWAGAQLAC